MLRGYRHAAVVAAAALIAATLGACQPTVIVPSAAPTPVVSPASSLAAGASPALARFDHGTWHFDYPSAWSSYRPVDPILGRGARAGILTSADVDEEQACRMTDDGLRCIASLIALDPGDVLVELTVGGGMLNDPVTTWTADDPNLGRPTIVAGVPARVTESVQAGYHRVRWEILNGRDLASQITVEIEVRQPQEAAALADVEALIDSWAFVPLIEPLDPNDAADFAAQAVRALRDGSPGYECFPEQAGDENVETVTNIGGYGLSHELSVTCTTAITGTSIGFWRVRLTAAWEAEAGEAAGEMVVTQWLASDGTMSSFSNRHATPPYCCT